MKALKSVGAWLLLVGLLVGTPATLVRWGVSPAVLSGWWIADDGRLLLGLLSALAWLAWGVLTLSIAAETVNVVARRRVVRLPLLGGLQVLAASLIVAALSASMSSGQASAEPRTPPRAVLTGSAVGGVAFERPLVRGNQESADPTRSERITVVPGDTLSELAQEHLGAAHRWPELYRANRDRIADPDLIQVGWRLILPTRQHGAMPDVRAMRPVRKPPATAVPRTPPVPGRPTGAPRVDSEAGGPSVTAGLGTSSQQPGGARVEAVDPTVPLVGAVGGLTAAMILGAMAVRRQAQLRSRPVGRRIAHPSAQARRYETALGHRERPDVTVLLERVLRTLGRHFFEVGRVPRLRLLTVGADGFTLEWWEVPPRPPLAFEADGERWRITFADAHRLPASAHPVPYPALVTLGRDPAGAHVMIDLEQRETLAVLGSDPEVRAGVLAAWCVELTCAPWAGELHVTYVGGDRFVAAAGGEGLVVLDSVEDALTRLADEVAAREAAFPNPGALRLARVNQDLSESSAASIVVFADELNSARCDRLLDLIDGAGIGIGAVLGGGPCVATSWTLNEDDPVVGTLSPDAMSLAAQAIPAAARQAIGELAAATSRPHTAAPWWPEADSNVVVLPSRPPAAVPDRLATALGPSPVGADGPLPRRATGPADDRPLDPAGMTGPGLEHLYHQSGMRVQGTEHLHQPTGTGVQDTEHLQQPTRMGGRATDHPDEHARLQGDATDSMDEPGGARGDVSDSMDERAGVRGEAAVSTDERAGVPGEGTVTTDEPGEPRSDATDDRDHLVEMRGLVTAHSNEPASRRGQATGRTDERAEPGHLHLPRPSKPDPLVRVARAVEHPSLLLVGPVELRGARGQEPPRARRQCEEYCGWLLENPGRTATQMAADLVVAEGTRRSNMSRLRTWLGSSDEGEQYLPEAYSGRITLHPLVTSDWQRIQLLAAPGLAQVGSATLQRILDLVRGAPLADAAPGQWHWAEELRTDMGSLIRDAAAVLSQRARNSGDLDLARWAASRALTATPEDELLLVERIRTEHQAGNPREVERLVQRVTQQARTLGVDLETDTIRACQEAMEGRIRARA